MLCQQCNKNEAEKYYMGNWNGNLFLAAFCTDCIEQMGHKASAAGYGEVFHRMTGWVEGKEDPRADGTVPFPEQADSKLITQTRLNALRYRLEEAANREDYQEAARLRDVIRAIEQEEGCHEF